MSKLRLLWKNLFNDHHHIEDRLIRMISLVLSLLLIPTVGLNYMLDLPPAINAILGVLIVFYSGIFFYTKKHPITSKVKLVFIGLGFSLLIPLWFLNGGILGSVTPFLFLLLFMGSIVLDKQYQYHLPVSILICLGGLVTIEFLYPDLVVDYESEAVQRWDIALSLVSTLMASAGLIITFRLSYIKDHDQLLNVTQDLNRSNKKLQVAKEVAEQASNAKTSFLAKMSHELRTPLNTIIGANDLLKKKKLTPEQAELVQLMEESSDLLLNLISDILDLSKVEADRLEVKNAPTDIHELAKNMAQFTRFKIEETNKSIEFSWSMGQNVPKGIIGDNLRLKQVLTNLISNAVKYTDQGKIGFSIDCFTDPGQKEWLSFRIEDTGIGIPASQMEFIRQPFRQVINTRNENGGAGLGLAICQSLATLMGGYMTIESEVGQGSTFTFALPLRRHDFAIEKGHTPRLVSNKPLNEVKVLLTEDNRVNQIIIAKLLESLSIKADLAENGAEAVEMVRQNKYDIVLMDLHMPVMNGLDASTKILTDSSIEHKPHIIALTANALKEDEEQCRKLGMHGFLSKPVTSQRLENEIRSVIDTSYLELIS